MNILSFENKVVDVMNELHWNKKESFHLVFPTIFEFRKVLSVFCTPNDYRIYSRIRREILDKNLTKFFQFNLYASQTFVSLNCIFI